VLLAGPAGVGKTGLASEALARSGLRVLRAPAGVPAATAYGPIVGTRRAFLRLAPDGLATAAGLGRYLPALLPELGSPPAEVDRATLFEAIVGAFATIAQLTPTAVFLDDLQDADHATLELLPYLAAATRELPLLLLGAYRAAELRLLGGPAAHENTVPRR
jgi:hypothetical protein